MTVTASLGQYVENAFLNWLRGTAFPAVPASWYLALFVTPPVNGSDGAAVEVAGNAYARVAISPSVAAFTAPSGAAPATSALAANAVFPTPTGSWGSVSGWALYDAPSGGNLIMYGAFGSFTPASGQAVVVLSGNLVISVA